MIKSMQKSIKESATEPIIPTERIDQKIYLIRGFKIMLDSDLAELYEVETKNLNKAVNRNLERFPEDFMFQLNTEESENLRFQFGTSKIDIKRKPYLSTGFSSFFGKMRF